jgi:hypothetical protein
MNTSIQETITPVYQVTKSNSHVRTFSVFLDLPRHIEFRMDDLPLLSMGTMVEFNLIIKNPRDSSKTRSVKGMYVVARTKLQYLNIPGKEGLSQYLEWEPLRI